MREKKCNHCNNLLFLQKVESSHKNRVRFLAEFSTAMSIMHKYPVKDIKPKKEVEEEKEEEEVEQGEGEEEQGEEAEEKEKKTAIEKGK